MATCRRNLTLCIRSDIREQYLKYCEETGIQKGALAERLFDSYLKGETFTPADVGALKPVIVVEPEPAPELCQDS